MTAPAAHREHEVWHDPASARFCEQVWQSQGERAHRALLAGLCQRHIPPGASVLEAGCGTGLVYAALVPDVISNGQYTGIDIAEPMLELAREHHPDGRFRHGDAYRTGFADGAYDVVACFAVLGHLPGTREVIAELIRVARRVVLFTVWPAAAGVEEGTEDGGGGQVALHRRYSHDHVTGEIAAGPGGASVTVTTEDLGDGVRAYILAKGTP